MKKLLFVAVTALILAFAAALPAGAQYEPMFITVSPTGVTSCGSDTGSVTINAGYFAPGSNVVVTLQSDPVTLGTVVASATGTISATYSLPVGVTAGTHTVIATGARLDTGVAESVSASITVTVPPGCVLNQSVTSTPSGSSSSGSLPTTGTDAGVYVAVGAALLVAGGLIVMASRRRNEARA